MDVQRDEEKEESPAFTTVDYDKFNPDDYLNFFYSSKACDSGTKLPIFALSTFARRLPVCSTFIDIGSGTNLFYCLPPTDSSL